MAFGMKGSGQSTCAAVLAAGGVALLWPTPAAAEPPPAEAFEIYYYRTDEEGDKAQRMTTLDLQQWVNRARCDCIQNIIVDITLLTTAGVSYDNVPLTPYVGFECSAGQDIGGYNPKCVAFDTAFTQDFTRTHSYSFDPLWLAQHIAPNSSQGIAKAVPWGGCDMGGQGQAGVWICAETDEVSGCQSGEFIVTGTQSSNVPEGEEGQGLAFDFDAPIAPPTNFSVAAGDGAVEITWELGSTGDVNGYRILCAEMNGDPVDGKGTSGPDPEDENKGTIYFTQGNLCPNGPFGEGYGDIGTGTGTGTDAGGTGTDATGTSTGAGTGTGTGAGTGTGTGTNTGTGTDTGTNTGANTGTGTGATGTGATGTGGTGGSGGTGTGDGLPDQGIGSLDWDYVCSGHIPATTTKGRVTGLTNNREYQFLVVAYDLAGNPVAGEVITAEPIETNDLWEQCEEQGGICGESGFCGCRTDDNPGPEALLGLGLLAWARGRRRRRS
jgi:MYXO-CTERM domain-containing protein